MKIFTLSILVFLLFGSCGPSGKELELIQLEKDQITADSIEAIRVTRERRIERERAIADSVARVYQARLDSKVNSPVELRQDLQVIERNNPLRYLKVNFKFDYKLIGNRYILKGEVVNSATLARYKDVELEVYCYSKTKTLIKTIKITIYDYIPAMSKVEFDHKFKLPKGTKNVTVGIVRAKPA